MHNPLSLVIAFIALWCIGFSTHAQEITTLADDRVGSNEEFLSLKQAYENRRPVIVSENVWNNHPLEGYVQAWKLLSELKQSQNTNTKLEKLRTFQKAHQGEFVADYFTREWLASQAQELHQKNQWKTFTKIRNELHLYRNDPEFICWSMYHDLQSATSTKIKKISQAAIPLFKQPAFENNAVCKRTFNLLIEVNPSLGFTRLVTLMQLNRGHQAKTVLQSLIKHKRLPKAQATMAFSRPNTWYKKYRRQINHQNKYVALIAAYRLSRTDLSKATFVANALNKRLNREERGAIWGHIGYTAALRQNPKALTWYRVADSTVCRGRYAANQEACLEWQIRSALKVENWKLVNRYISRLPKSTQQKDTWLYWQGRALAAMGQAEAAKKQWQQITNVRTYYGKLAAQALGHSITYQPQAETQVTQEQLASIKDKSFSRAIAFYDMGLYSWGHREWNWGLKNLPDVERLIVAQWAFDHDRLDRMINTAVPVASRLPVSHGILYPRPHEKTIHQFALRFNLNEDWIYGLIRQESRFMVLVSSSAGANGLMQIMPATAQWIAKQLEQTNFQRDDIYKIDTNIQFGTYYLRSLLDRLDQNMVLATAGYNAGPQRAKQWRSSLSKPTEAAIFIETIPFTETRGYVQNVLANTVEYASRTEKPIGNFKDWLGVISPKPLDDSEEPI